MKDLRELVKNQEEDLLFWAIQNVIEDLPIIYTEFGLDYEVVDKLLENLYNNFKDKDCLEMIDSAISLSETVRLDFIANKIDLTVGRYLFYNLLTEIEIFAKRCISEKARI